MWERPGAFPTCAQADTLTLTHSQTHMHTHTCTRTDVCTHVSVHRRHISTTHSHACYMCAHTYTHVTQPCSTCLHKILCLCTHRKTRMRTHTHLITSLSTTQSRCGVSIPLEASPLSLYPLSSLTCRSTHVSVCLPVDITSMCLIAGILGAEGWATCLR